MVSTKNRMVLWARTAGRCQYQGCNCPLVGDLVSGRDTLNAAYIAHIVAEKPDGPRGDPARSPLLADAIENLMLLCDVHHRLIDREGLAVKRARRGFRIACDHDQVRALVDQVQIYPAPSRAESLGEWRIAQRRLPA